jgi:hypothetical protein
VRVVTLQERGALKLLLLSAELALQAHIIWLEQELAVGNTDLKSFLRLA